MFLDKNRKRSDVREHEKDDERKRDEAECSTSSQRFLLLSINASDVVLFLLETNFITQQIYLH